MATCCCNPTGDHPGRHRHPALSRVFRSASGVFRSAPDPAQHRRGILGRHGRPGHRGPVRRPPLLALLGGEAGVGKTRLIEQFAAAAEEQGVRVLGGGCVPLGEEGLPFAPVTEALRGLVCDLDPADLEVVAGPARQELGRLLPDLAWGGQAAAADPSKQ